MFENILNQNIVLQLKKDILDSKLAPAVLFSGTEYAGKGTSALELARVLSCEAQGKWNCTCGACQKHRLLAHSDLLLLGRRHFFEEISAAANYLLREPQKEGARILFSRAVQKLLARFAPVLWEDDPKIKKVTPLIAGLEEDLDEIGRLENEKLEKCCGGIVKNSAKLESEGLGEQIPVALIRRASYWSRLAPLGKHKCVIIENAERMQEGAKNSLLKILEEPPASLTVVLTSSRAGSLLPTIVSRLRVYQFAKRGTGEEREVIRRIFHDEYEGGIAPYLESFLPVNDRVLYPLSAFFAASTAACAVRELRQRGRPIPGVLVDLGKFAAPVAENAGLGRPAQNTGEIIEAAVKTCGGFQIPHVGSLFFRNIRALVSAWLRNGKMSVEKSAYAQLWSRELEKSAVRFETYNINPVLTLEGLCESLAKGMAV
ncbi:MAG: DNA polymerase III [Treponema sp.]|jgi:DNA polymerase-3 subunit gamma/tau|nr:DNA polymerase III [Treponema sp.]